MIYFVWATSSFPSSRNITLNNHFYCENTSHFYCESAFSNVNERYIIMSLVITSYKRLYILYTSDKIVHTYVGIMWFCYLFNALISKLRFSRDKWRLLSVYRNVSEQTSINNRKRRKLVICAWTFYVEFYENTVYEMISTIKWI